MGCSWTIETHDAYVLTQDENKVLDQVAIKIELRDLMLVIADENWCFIAFILQYNSIII